MTPRRNAPKPPPEVFFFAAAVVFLAGGLERVLLVVRLLEERVEVRDAMLLRVSGGGDRTGLRNAGPGAQRPRATHDGACVTRVTARPCKRQVRSTATSRNCR